MRRSKRERRRVTKYDGLDETAQQLMQEIADASDMEAPEVQVQDHNGGSDDDFQDVPMQDTIVESEEEHIQRKGKDLPQRVSPAESDTMDDSSISTPDDSDGDTAPEPRSAMDLVSLARQKQKKRVDDSSLGQVVRSRLQQGTQDRLRTAKDKVHTVNYGPLIEDLFPILQSRDVWMRGRDAILPSQKTLAEALQLRETGYLTLKTSLQLSSRMRTPARLKDQTCQLVHNMTAAQVHQACSPSTTAHEVVLGSFTHGTKIRLDHCQVVDTAAAWQSDSSPHNSWLTNISARPRCMSWSVLTGPTQYLAIASQSTSKQRTSAPHSENKRSPAFDASGPYSANIQIWQYYGRSSDTNEATLLDYDTQPVLSQTLCTDFGDHNQIEWLPSSTLQESNLLVLSTDGNLRLICLDLSTAAKAYIHVQRPALIARPHPHALFTCFCLATPEDLIVGASDGTISIFSLVIGSSASELTPYTTVQIHATYISALCTATDYPHFLSSTSAGGELMLTDLRNPTQERIPVHKSRLPTRNMSYLPFTRHFVTTSDSSGNSETYGTTVSTVVAHNLRHYYQGSLIMKLPEAAGVATVLATSQFHPIILAANAAGSVFATNYLRKLMPGKRVEGGTAYMQKLCEYDWQPLQSTDPTAAKGASLYHGRDARPGISRIHEGFKPERVWVAPKASRPGGGERDAEGGSTVQVVLPEELAVTTMCWNKSEECSSWVAIGWGSGLVRVMDLSHGVT